MKENETVKNLFRFAKYFNSIDKFVFQFKSGRNACVNHCLITFFICQHNSITNKNTCFKIENVNFVFIGFADKSFLVTYTKNRKTATILSFSSLCVTLTIISSLIKSLNCGNIFLRPREKYSSI